MPQSITTVAPPAVQDVVVANLGYMTAQSGIITDARLGGVARTLSESIGGVVEEQAIISQARAVQALVYSAYQALNITPLSANLATVSLTFAAPGPLAQSIVVGAGSQVQTLSGQQFATVAAITLPAGAVSASGVAIATVAGAAGNVAAGAITQITTTQATSLTVTNPLPATGGADAESPAQTFARFTAAISAIGVASPVAVANACIGVQTAGGAETVLYAVCDEPWQRSVSAGAGYNVYIDNGSGAASAALVLAVIAVLNGDATLAQNGYRPAGVPFTVSAVAPVGWRVSVAAQLIDATDQNSLSTDVLAAVTAYAAELGFASTVERSQITVAVGQVLQGYVLSLSVLLLDANSVAQETIPTLFDQRPILGGVDTSGISVGVIDVVDPAPSSSASTLTLNPIGSVIAGSVLTLAGSFSYSNGIPATLIVTLDGVTSSVSIAVNGNFWSASVGSAPAAGSHVAQVQDYANRAVVSNVVDFQTTASPASMSLAPFVFTQATPASVWNITHYLNRDPNVVVTDSAGNFVEGGVFYNNPNQLTLTFDSAFAGIASLL